MITLNPRSRALAGSGRPSTGIDADAVRLRLPGTGSARSCSRNGSAAVEVFAGPGSHRAGGREDGRPRVAARLLAVEHVVL